MTLLFQSLVIGCQLWRWGGSTGEESRNSILNVLWFQEGLCEGGSGVEIRAAQDVEGEAERRSGFGTQNGTGT